MNQILVTEKLYVTPELKRKKKMYKVQFFISVFLICLLSSYYIYAEYDRNKSEEVSQFLLSEVRTTEDDTTKKSTQNDALIIVLNENESEQVEQESVSTNEIISNTTVDGVTYTTEAIITIPKIDITYPVLSETSDELLSISVNRYWPKPDKLKPNEVGNYCIVGHNYRNGKMFGRLNELVNGDIVVLEDMTGRKVQYAVYNTYIVNPDDTSCTSQLANGKPLTRREITLITCTNYGTQRLVVKCREV